MKKSWVFLSILASGLISSSAHAECLVIQHFLTVETRCNLGDLDENEQRQLMYGFIDQVRAQMSSMSIPQKADARTEQLLKEAQNNLSPLVRETNDFSKDYRRSRGGITRDLIPSGFFFEIGLNASINLGPGFGTSFLVTFAAVPTQVKIVNKITGSESDRTEWQQDSGGLVQVGGGLGGGGGFGMRGGLGIIWGDLPHPSDVIGAGLAEGVSLDAQIFGGAGVTAIDSKNKETGLNNVVVFAHFDGGPGAKFEAHGCAFYLMDRKQVAKLFHLDSIKQIEEKIKDAAD